MKRRRIVASKDDEWSIGIYEGTSPYDLAPVNDGANPVLTARDVDDIKAEFVADPFMIRHTSKWYMFFEVLNALTGRGEIGLATSDDGLRWGYERIVLREPYHLSYPYVFRDRDDFYMIPETVSEDSVTLYKAEAFPHPWKPVGAMIRGTFADPSVVRYQGRWWLFACSEPYTRDVLRLYHADDLLGPWTEHPKSPIVEGDPVAGRCAGRILDLGDHLVRFAQDCSKRYGQAVNAFKVTKISEFEYEEERVTLKPLLKDAGQLARGSRWNRHGMHHIDASQVDGGSWLACVDGYRRLLSVRMEY